MHDDHHVRQVAVSFTSTKEGIPSKLAFFDAPHPWGPWTAAGYVTLLGSGHGGELRYDPRLPAKWFSHV